MRKGAYLTDLEVELSPPLLRFEAEHGGQRRAQAATWLHVHEHFHLEQATNSLSTAVEQRNLLYWRPLKMAPKFRQLN